MSLKVTSRPISQREAPLLWRMDYHAIHGYDTASFDISNIHRLPTITASQALQELGKVRSFHISTGIETLDEALLSSESIDSGEAVLRGHGGIKRGQVTEVWGPPGSGKTAIGIQLAANTLIHGHDVVWVDCAQRVSTGRISRVLQHAKEARDADTRAGELTHHSCETLAHFINLISRPTATCVPNRTSLIVASNLSALINAHLPRPLDGKSGFQPGKGSAPPSAKRLRGLQYIISSLQKLAVTRSLAVVLLSQCATRIKAEQGPTLVPAVNATAWENGVSTRVVLFRDWTWDRDELASVFLAGLAKIDDSVAHKAVGHVSAFTIDASGVAGVHYKAARRSSLRQAMSPRRKRKRGQSDAEIPDSEDDEDYGWADEDEDALPPPPSQWQGSEDLILGQDVGLSEGEGEESNDDAAEEAADDDTCR